MGVDEFKVAIAALKRAARSEDLERISSVSAAYYEAVCENFELRDEVQRLRAEVARNARTSFVGGFLYVEDDEGDMCGPICPSCYMEGIVSVLGKTSSRGICGRCKASYYGAQDADMPACKHGMTVA